MPMINYIVGSGGEEPTLGLGYQEFYEGILESIVFAANANRSFVIISISPAEIDFIDLLGDQFRQLGYQLDFSADTSDLTISWGVLPPSL